MGSDNIVYVQESAILNGVLRFSSLTDNLKETGFLDQYSSLKNRDRLPEFQKYLQDNNIELVFEDSSSEERYNSLSRSTVEPFIVNSPFLEDHSLFPFQHVGLNLAWEKLKTKSPRVLVQWDTGAGKTLFSCLTAQRLFDEGRVDKVFVFCKKIKQYDWEQEFKRMTTLSVARLGTPTRKARHEFYEEDKSQVLVLNYEKARGPSLIKIKGQKGKVEDFARTDIKQLLDIYNTEGYSNILIIIDEAQKINTGNSLLSDGFDRLLNKTNKNVMCLALTATPYTTSPLNIRNIFATIAPGIPGVSNMDRDDFKREYGKTLDYYGTKWARQLYVKEWDKSKLPILGKKHEDWTHIAMKSDPMIAKQFPESMPKKVVYELSDIDREIYDYAEKLAREKFNPDNPVTAWGYIDTLRMICNTTAGLKNSKSHFAQELVDHFKDAISIENSSKYQLIEAALETAFESNDKVVLFTFWTHGTLFPYMEALQNKFHGVPILPIWGVGMESDQVTKNIKQFNGGSGPAVLITSDVGQEGLNLYAPYLWNIEVPRTYAEYKQRSNRINRADSKSKGISHTWIYRPVASNTIEERVDAKVLRRRAEAEAIRGVVDELGDMEDTIDVSPKALLFGI